MYLRNFAVRGVRNDKLPRVGENAGRRHLRGKAEKRRGRNDKRKYTLLHIVVHYTKPRGNVNLPGAVATPCPPIPLLIYSAVFMTTILHVDMDAFFASVELLHHPEWRGKPLIVGSGPHERGVVSTCSYEARKFGVHSAMPSRTAYARCPHAIFTPPHMKLYAEVSRKAFSIFERFTPYVEGVSIDEAFLDITGSIHLYGNAKTLGETLRETIHRELGVTCSVGIAPNRLLAKLGSEEHKPNGLTMMPFEPDAIARFLAPKKIGVLWGIGKTTEATLLKFGLKTCADLQRIDPRQLERIVGASAAISLKNHALGISDDRVYWEESDEKSVSREYTFAEDEPRREEVRRELLALVEEVGHRFRSEKRWALTARLKVRSSDFTTFTRQTPFDKPACDDMTFREKALELFDAAVPMCETLPRPIRLIGFGVTNIRKSPLPTEPELFSNEEDVKREKRERLAHALDALRDKGLKL